MSRYLDRIGDLVATLDSPLVHRDAHRDLFVNWGGPHRGEPDFTTMEVVERTVGPSLSSGERAILRVAMMLGAEQSVNGWDFLVELRKLDPHRRELALRALDGCVGLL